MITRLIKWVGAKALNRWILGGLVAMLLGGGGLMWYKYKEGLRDEGRFECVQKINEQTVIDLQNALAEERATATELRALATAAAEANESARAKLRESEAKVRDFKEDLRGQKNNDKEYAAWSDVPLPAGVADRLRKLSSGSNTNPSNEDSN